MTCLLQRSRDAAHGCLIQIRSEWRCIGLRRPGMRDIYQNYMSDDGSALQTLGPEGTTDEFIYGPYYSIFPIVDKVEAL